MTDKKMEDYADKVRDKLSKKEKVYLEPCVLNREEIENLKAKDDTKKEKVYLEPCVLNKEEIENLKAKEDTKFTIIESKKLKGGMGE